MDRRPAPPDAGDSDCVAGDPAPAVAQPRRRFALAGRVLLWLLIFALVSIVGGVAGAVLVPECRAQILVALDTTTTQYLAHPERVEQIARKDIRRIAEELGLDRWRILVVADSIGEQNGEPIAASTSANHQYRNAKIVLNLTLISEDRLLEILYHEVLHVRLAELMMYTYSLTGGHGFITGVISAASEGLVTDLARAMVKRNGDWK